MAEVTLGVVGLSSISPIEKKPVKLKEKKGFLVYMIYIAGNRS